MKKIFSTNLFISILVFFLLLMPWNINLANSGCDEFLNKTGCKNSLIIIPKHITENSVQEEVPGVFPFDELIIKI